MEYKCLIIDDEPAIAETTAEYFNMFDISTASATSYSEGLKFIEQNEVSLILLDINLNGRSGFELCKQIRETSNVPILFISARTSDDDILTALNIGGDDYIAKPYTLNILLAKVKAVLKRYEEANAKHEANADEKESKLEKSADIAATKIVKIANKLEIDYNYRQVIRNGAAVKLKDMEFKLLDYLVCNKNRVISKNELFDNVWNDSFVGEGTLSVHIRHLREKIEETPNQPKYIKTVWGVGYVFEMRE